MIRYIICIKHFGWNGICEELTATWPKQEKKLINAYIGISGVQFYFHLLGQCFILALNMFREFKGRVEVRQRRETARKHLTEEHQVVWWWTDGLVQGLGKATGKSLSDTVLFYCLLRPQFVLSLRCLWQTRFTLIVVWVGFPFFKNLKLGTLGGEGMWHRRPNFKTSRIANSKVNY